MSIIIDRRRGSRKKSTVNRQRFLKRYKTVIKKAVQDAIDQRSIKDAQQGSDVTIPKKDVSEPVYHHGPGGQQKHVHPGNKEFSSGDRIDRPPEQGKGGGKGEASDSGFGEDDFVFQINRDEFLGYLFEDLELPNLIRKELRDNRDFKLKRAGFTMMGSPDRLNVVRTLCAAHARRIALSGKERREIRELKRELRELETAAGDIDQERLEALRNQITALNKKLRRLPFIDDFDMRFNNLVKVPQPSSKAVMFCIMDVSASMSELIKSLAKRFFLLLYLFLERNYEALEVVFIRHHTEAMECSEHDFFYSTETGGTVVSRALELTHNIIKERFSPARWNIYIAQASDGDNWGADNERCSDILQQKLLPCTQYFAYVEIAEVSQALWLAYQKINKAFPDNFSQQRIRKQGDIYPVFHRLFEKREG